MGRDDALSSIGEKLKGRAVVVVRGLRGAGKTTLAAAYAEKHRGDYRTTWWIRAQTEPTLRADLVALGVRLGWVAADEKEEPAVAAVTERLRHEGDGVLLIYDTYDRVNKQISFQWFAIGTALQPHSSYSLDIICPPKAGQQKVP